MAWSLGSNKHSMNFSYCYCLLLILLFKDFIGESECAYEHVHCGKGKGQGGGISNRLCWAWAPLGAQSHNPEIMTWADTKSQMLNCHPGTPVFCYYWKKQFKRFPGYLGLANCLDKEDLCTCDRHFKHYYSKYALSTSPTKGEACFDTTTLLLYF